MAESDITLKIRQPVYVVIFATIGPISALLVLGTLMRIPPLKWIAAVGAGTVAISWPLGFAMAIIMLCSGIDGVHILLCWLILLMGYFTFVVCNHRRLAGIVQEYNSDDGGGPILPAEKRGGGKRRRKTKSGR
ncbi:hypothetical protein [Brenneria tiliae]|uniref:Uncharacterized protein n=1 Tax=Brenneria tiliae TaxID=2914984 RepID=A0ABT0MWN2_9GAMM|nr:hypothetical protein [Brenneria tiliae]MCL2894251.1 hypothetical protein [Brenneria tiliae]